MFMLLYITYIEAVIEGSIHVHVKDNKTQPC